MNPNIININLSQYNDGYLYQAIPKQHFQAQFMKKLSSTEAELNKGLLIKTACISV